MRILDHDRHLNIYISREISIEHPSVGLASLAQLLYSAFIFFVLWQTPWQRGEEIGMGGKGRKAGGKKLEDKQEVGKKRVIGKKILSGIEPMQDLKSS